MATTKLRLRLAQAQLSGCLARVHYAPQICASASDVLSGLAAAQINARIPSAVKLRLLEDVAKLEELIR